MRPLMIRHDDSQNDSTDICRDPTHRNPGVNLQIYEQRDEPIIRTLRRRKKW